MSGKLISKKNISESTNVFDIEVEKNHNYFANDILVHNCKSHDSQQSKNLLKLSAKYQIGATGTLILNNPCDCYVPLKWIGADRSTYSNFRYYYCDYGGQFHNDLIGYKNLKYLKDQLEEVSLRRPKEILNLPPKTIINEQVDLENSQRTFYNNIKRGIIDEVDKVELNPTSVLGMVTRLRQATACPSILTTENISSAKIDRACDLVEEICSNNEKVVIFSTFKETANTLFNMLQEYYPLLNTGDIPQVQIDANMKAFQEDDKHLVFIATWQKCGTGITLTKAHTAIFIDTPWTNAEFEQSQDRIYRIGTKESVLIYNLIATNTIDERVSQLVQDKELLGEYVIDNKVSPKLADRLKEIILDLE